MCSVLITELCDTDVTEITELPAEEANGQTYALKPHQRIGIQRSATRRVFLMFTCPQFSLADHAR